LLLIKEGMHIVSGRGAKSTAGSAAKIRAEGDIKNALQILRAFDKKCYDKLSDSKQSELDEVTSWLEEPQSTLNKKSIQPQLRYIKKPTSRSSIDTLSDNLFGFSKFTSTLPNALLKKMNSFVTPKPQKQTPAQIRAEIDEGQRQEIARRKSQATMKPANDTKTINFGFGAIAVPNFGPLIH
jgi:hypothetical protein